MFWSRERKSSVRRIEEIAAVDEVEIELLDDETYEPTSRISNKELRALLTRSTASSVAFRSGRDSEERRHRPKSSPPPLPLSPEYFGKGAAVLELAPQDAAPTPTPAPTPAPTPTPAPAPTPTPAPALAPAPRAQATKRDARPPTLVVDFEQNVLRRGYFKRRFVALILVAGVAATPPYAWNIGEVNPHAARAARTTAERR